VSSRRAQSLRRLSRGTTRFHGHGRTPWRSSNQLCKRCTFLFVQFFYHLEDSNSLYVSQISTCSVQANKASLQTTIASLNHVPTKESWDLAVTKALQMIKGRQRELVKVSRSVNFDPIILTAKSISGFRGCHFI
jgi:isochorismate synthase EntC